MRNPVWGAKAIEEAPDLSTVLKPVARNFGFEVVGFFPNMLQADDSNSCTGPRWAAVKELNIKNKLP